jgi:hypothetical protein
MIQVSKFQIPLHFFFTLLPGITFFQTRKNWLTHNLLDPIFQHSSLTRPRRGVTLTYVHWFWEKDIKPIHNCHALIILKITSIATPFSYNYSIAILCIASDRRICPGKRPCYDINATLLRHWPGR